ncbi:MAG TPA: helix-turn-helix domain-containing protein [Gemmatimonadaceae bacterium]|nr:helix-turn-helix domain-containing protein [Gemmatimonadaceae bacterium]
MTHYGQFCPVALGAEIFAERWTPLIVRELLHGGCSFSDLHRGVPRISRNLLTQRLESLRLSGIVEQVQANGERRHLYRLTTAGRELAPVIEALGIWGFNWASKDLSDEHLDPDFLMWALRRMVRVDALPDERVVVMFRFRGYADRCFWLVLSRPEVDICVEDPGHEVNLEVEATVEALARVCLGHLDFLQVLKRGEIEVHGAPRYRSALAKWLGVTHFAAVGRKPDLARLNA